MLGFGLVAGCLALSAWIPPWLGWLLVTGVLFLYSLFFDGEPFGRQWWRVLLPGLLLAALLIVLTNFAPKKVTGLHPIVFIGLSAVVGVAFGFAGA